jgi:hypothetical protein
MDGSITKFYHSEQLSKVNIKATHHELVLHKGTFIAQIDII